MQTLQHTKQNGKLISVKHQRKSFHVIFVVMYFDDLGLHVSLA